MYLLDKYAPKSIDEHICHDAVKYITEWYKQGSKKPLLLVGSTGIGKSTLVRLFADYNNLRVYELTPSDYRDKDSIQKELLAVSNSRSVFGQKNLIFLDDVDVFNSDDRGGVEVITDISENATVPVIFTATDLYSNKKTSKFKEISDVFQIKKPSYLSIASMLKFICKNEGISYQDDAVKELALSCDGDIRSAILDLESLPNYNVDSESIKLIGKRERKEDVFKTILGLFKSRTLKEAIDIRDASDSDYDILFAWMCENLHLFYKYDNLKDAYNLVSIADLNRSRIYVRQNWTFLKYFLVLGIVAPAIYPKKDEFSYRISFPTFIRMMSKETSSYSKNKKAAQVLQNIIHGSKSEIIANIEYYKVIFSSKEVFDYLSAHTTDDELEFIVDFFDIPKSYLKSDDDVKPKKKLKKDDSSKELKNLDVTEEIQKDNKQKKLFG